MVLTEDGNWQDQDQVDEQKLGGVSIRSSTSLNAEVNLLGSHRGSTQMCTGS